MRVIITGAASGIGLATAQRLVADAVKAGTTNQTSLLLVDRDKKYLEEAVAELRQSGVRIEAQCADLTDPVSCKAVVDAAREAFGGLDAIVSNAGILQFSTLMDLSLENYELAFAINTRATWLLAKAAFEMLKESKGTIVATASLSAHACAPHLGAYAPSKAALLMIMRQLAAEMGPFGIRCNTISPGSTNTNIIGRELAAQLAAAATQGQAKVQTDGNPMGFSSQPADQAGTIAFLLSSDARFINGADIVVDGGKQSMLLASVMP